jgi:hypothetical protein
VDVPSGFAYVTEDSLRSDRISTRDPWVRAVSAADTRSGRSLTLSAGAAGAAGAGAAAAEDTIPAALDTTSAVVVDSTTARTTDRPAEDRELEKGMRERERTTVTPKDSARATGPDLETTHHAAKKQPNRTVLARSSDVNRFPPSSPFRGSDYRP